MKIGVSTASLYNMHTEDALFTLAELGVKNAEIFLNSTGELEGEVFAFMKKTVAEHGVNIISAHPFSSPMESLFLFSSYDRRVNEMLDMYKRYFEAMNGLGAKIFVIHGAILSAKCTDERYEERLSLLIKEGAKFGITVAQENVSYCKSGDPGFLAKLSRDMGDEVKFVLDVKQARRAGCDPFNLVELIGEKIIHLHLSDCLGKNDCVPPGKGDFDFAKLFGELKKRGYDGDAVIELYRDNYGDYAELNDCVEYLKKIHY